MRMAASIARDARVSAGLTQAQLGRRMGMSQPAIARLEAADANPTVQTLDRLVRATGHRLELRAVAPTIDETLLAEDLALEPAERLERFMALQRQTRRLHAIGARARGDAA